MSNVLHRPQPLPLARLRASMVCLVVVLHGVVLCLTSLLWPLQMSLPTAAPATPQNTSAQGFTSTTVAATSLKYQVITDFGRQRFGRADTKLVLAQTQARRSTAESKNTAVAMSSTSSVDAPIKLILSSSYIDRQLMRMPGINTK